MDATSKVILNAIAPDSPPPHSIGDEASLQVVNQLLNLKIVDHEALKNSQEPEGSEKRSPASDNHSPTTPKTHSTQLPTPHLPEQGPPFQFVWDRARGLLGSGKPRDEQPPTPSNDSPYSQKSIWGLQQGLTCETALQHSIGLGLEGSCRDCLFFDAEEIRDAFSGTFEEETQKIERDAVISFQGTVPVSPTVSDSATGSVFSSLATYSTGRTTPESGDEDDVFDNGNEQEDGDEVSLNSTVLTPQPRSRTPLFFYVTPPSSPIYPRSPSSSDDLISIFECEFHAPGGGGVPLTHILARRRGCMIDPDEPAWGQDAPYFPDCIEVDLSGQGVGQKSVETRIRCSCTRMTRAHLAWRVITSFAAHIHENPYFHDPISELCLISIDVSRQHDGYFVGSICTDNEGS